LLLLPEPGQQVLRKSKNTDGYRARWDEPRSVSRFCEARKGIWRVGTLTI